CGWTRRQRHGVSLAVREGEAGTALPVRTAAGWLHRGRGGVHGRHFHHEAVPFRRQPAGAEHQHRSGGVRAGRLPGRERETYSRVFGGRLRLHQRRFPFRTSRMAWFRQGCVEALREDRSVGVPDALGEAVRHAVHESGALMKAIGQIAAVVALAAPLRAWGAAPVPGPSTEAVPLMAYRTVRYVTPSGSDRAGDGSKTKPWATIGHALAQVGSASEASRAAVLVAAGKYRESIELKPYVDLFGGYEAGAWNRDVARFPSVLDGEGKRRIAVGADHARIDGFTLTHGKVRGKGGAILCDHTSPSISNNTFLENTTMGPEDWRPAEMHETANDGGAVAALNGAAPAIEH